MLRPLADVFLHVAVT